jgi:hypothetical protein
VVENATNSNIFSDHFILNLSITIGRRGRVSSVTMLWTGKPNYRGSILPVVQICLFSRTSRPPLEPPNLLCNSHSRWSPFYAHFQNQKCVQLYFQSHLRLQVHSKNCRKRLLTTSCPSVHLSICPHGAIRPPLNGFSWNFVFEYFSKIFPGNSRFIKIQQE